MRKVDRTLCHVRPAPRISLVGAFGLLLLLAVLRIAARVGDQALFVTWPVVAFTVVAASVAVIGAWTGARQPSMFAAGLLPALIVSYFLPAAPFPFVAAVLAGIGAAAVLAPGVMSGMAAGAGTLMALFVNLQGPVVECGASSVSSNSGPWWIDEPAQSSGSGTGTANGTSSGVVQVGDRHYRYTCEGARLRDFERTDR